MTEKQDIFKVCVKNMRSHHIKSITKFQTFYRTPNFDMRFDFSKTITLAYQTGNHSVNQFKIYGRSILANRSLRVASKDFRGIKITAFISLYFIHLYINNIYF